MKKDNDKGRKEGRQEGRKGKREGGKKGGREEGKNNVKKWGLFTKLKSPGVHNSLLEEGHHLESREKGKTHFVNRFPLSDLVSSHMDTGI